MENVLNGTEAERKIRDNICWVLVLMLRRKGKIC